MESIGTYNQNQQPQSNQPQPQATTSRASIQFPLPSNFKDHNLATSSQQGGYQVKCDLLEYHIQEAVLINRALRSELKQYKDKIDFEKKLREFLLNRVKSANH